MKYVCVVFIGFILASCTSGIRTRAVDLTPFFCDNSSKVWMVENVNLRDPSIPVAKIDFRDVMIFYKSRIALVQPLNSLGNQEYERASYSIDSEKRTLIMNFEKSKMTWIFKIESISNQRVTLQATQFPGYNGIIELVPLPEL